MKKLCNRCLTELTNNERICPICGLKRSRNYKNFIVISLSITLPLIALFAIFSYIASSQSKEKIAADFYLALSERDANALKKIIVHEDGSKISAIEAVAITKIITEIGEIEVEKLFYPIEHNKLLNTYKMTAFPVSLAHVEQPLSASIQNLNTEKLMPGNYPITISYDTIFPSSTSRNLTIVKPQTSFIKDFNLIDVEVSSIRNFPILFFNNIDLKIKDTVAPLSEVIALKNFTAIEGHSSEFEIINNLPWGVVSSGKRKFSNQLNLDFLPIVTEKQADHLKNMTTSALNSIAANEKPMKNTSTFLQNNPPVFMKKISTENKITEFEEQSIFANKNGEIVGAFFYLITDDALEMNALFTYDKPAEKWSLEILFSNDFVDSDTPYDYYKDSFHDTFYDKTDLHDLSAAQLNYWLEGFYFSEAVSATAKPLAEQNKIKNYNKYLACTSLKDAEVTDVKVITNDQVIIQTVDTCYDETSYEVTTTMSRNHTNYWVLDSINNKRKIE